ncbi:hypothetical protein F5144DRAFT_612140 [Chaetomium tenue]|uniref:Uncharacterized protein n=1 Tax=Chaetomium tenue TaxID=1854479 RepID=A0ACB7P650_9PEZI|nr:hypothetical protein F5144DRAFT_612140 [Chaetomium globosum]
MLAQPILSRYRRMQPTSSDSGEAGDFDVSNVRFRVGAPPPLPLPLFSRWDERCTLISDELGHRVLERETEEILFAEGAQDAVVAVELTSRLVQSANGGATRLPKASQPSSSWHVVRRVKKLVNSKRLTREKLRDIDIAVEMIAEELTPKKYLGPVPAEILARGLEKDWPQIKDRVFQIMESQGGTRGHTTTIGLFQLGFSPIPTNNPTTVYVSVDYDSDESRWPAAVEEIEQYIKQFDYAQLRLHLEHNIVESFPFPLTPSQQSEEDREKEQRLYNILPQPPYKTAVDLGDDIGASNYITANDGRTRSPAVGTLGCWLEMKSDDFPDWTKVALTNYHILRPAYSGFKLDAIPGGAVPLSPAEGSTLLKVDMEGVGWHPSAPRVEHPTRLKHNSAVQSAQDILGRFPGEPTRKLQDDLDQVVAFFDENKQVFGSVYCASGFTKRTRNNGRLDWGLVLPLDATRVGKNKLPSMEDWMEKYPNEGLQYPETFGTGLGQIPQAGLRGLQQGDTVYKVGATTRFTIGKFNCVKSDIKISLDKHMSGPRMSEEFAFISAVKTSDIVGRFSSPGDSGSVVWDQNGRAVGLLFRGQTPQQADKGSLIYVTPLEDVIADIKQRSGGKIKDIRIAVD